MTVLRVVAAAVLAVAVVMLARPLARATVAAGEPIPLVPVIPQPKSVARGDGEFALGTAVTLVAHTANERNVAALFTNELAESGIRATVGTSAAGPAVRFVEAVRDTALGAEGYRLVVSPDGVTVSANGGAGLFYGAQTLAQLVPDAAPRMLPSVRIVDEPAYRWRGIHLDVSRHFFDRRVVERYIDVAARFKLNVFHWHLTDDQGWRLPVAAYPRLTSAGGCRAATQVGGEGETATDGRRYCGAYTAADVRAVVAYAKRRYVTVVPEIEMPGHSAEVLGAYPELACAPGRYRTRALWGVSTEILCPSERTFAFIDAVLRESATLFPGPYVHVGGDEVPKDAWVASPLVSALRAREHLRDLDAVQGYFTRRVERIARRYGKRIVGWDDVLAGGVTRRAVVMAWHGEGSAVDAARRGNDVVLTPDPPLYFDAYQGNPDTEPLAIGGLTTLDMVAAYDPLPAGISPDAARHVLGAQGNLWTEYVPTEGHLFYMLLPRALALAEACWVPHGAPRLAFDVRAGAALARLARRGVPFRVPAPEPRLEGDVDLGEQHPVPNRLTVRARGESVTVAFADVVPGAVLHVTRDGTVPGAASPRFEMPARVDAATLPVTFAAVAVLANGRTSAPTYVTLERAP